MVNANALTKEPINRLTDIDPQDIGAARLTGAAALIDYLADGNQEKTYMGSLVAPADGANYDDENEGPQVFTDQEKEIIRMRAAIENKAHPGRGYDRPDELSDEAKRDLLKKNRDEHREELVREMDYSKLYQTIYKGLKDSGSSNKHRRAAAQARSQAEAQRKNGQNNQNHEDMQGLTA